MSKVAERRQNLRDALIQAAEETISREGLAGLRARDLAKEVGCALGAIYNVFPDLDTLVLAVNARTLAAFEQFLGERNMSKTGRAAEVDPAVARLVHLAMAYLDFAVSYGLRWRALFEHRMAGKRQIPSWYVDAQEPLFSLVEEPLRALRPELDHEQRSLLARSSFAAVHGVVSLGLDGKLVPLPIDVLRQQVEEIVVALGIGLKRDTPSLAKVRASARASAQRRRK